MFGGLCVRGVCGMLLRLEVNKVQTVPSALLDAPTTEAMLLAHRSGQPFRLDPGHPFIGAFQDAARSVMGAPLPTAGILLASDINHVMELTGVPTILHGTKGAADTTHKGAVKCGT